MSYQDNRVYVLVEIQPGKEREFADEMLSKGLIIDSKVERMDFVHGSFDFVHHALWNNGAHRSQDNGTEKVSICAKDGNPHLL